MKKYRIAILFVVILASVSSAVIQFNIKYGEAITLPFPLWDSNSPWALYETAPATADCNLFRNEGSSESLDNAVVDEGPFMSWTISAAEATCKTAIMVIKDATAPPVFMDETIIITTFGDSNAFSAFDLDNTEPNVNVVEWLETACATPNIAGIPLVDINDVKGTDADTALMNDTSIRDNVRFAIKAAHGGDANNASLVSDVNNIHDIVKSGGTGDLAAIIADTNELQTAWTDGGRLDTLIDNIVLAVLLNPPTTVATVTSQTEITIASGSTDNDVYNDCYIVFQDASTSTQVARCTVKDYIGSTKTIKLYVAPGFTIATSDKVIILPIKHVRGGGRGGVVK